MGYLLEGGLYRTDDIGLIRRALYAVKVHRAAQQYIADMNGLTASQWALVVEIRRRLKQARQSPPRKSSSPRRSKRKARKQRWILNRHG